MGLYRMRQGVGKHRIGAVVYRPGEKIELTDLEAEKIQEKIEPLKGPARVETPDPPSLAPTEVGTPDAPPKSDEPLPELAMVAAEGDSGLWNVFNPISGRNINDEPLSHADAVSLITKKD